MRVVNQSTDRDRVNRGNRVKQKEVAAATFRAAETEKQRENRVEQIQPIETKDRFEHFEMFSILK